MKIEEIKAKLTLAEVLKHYGLKADKQNRLHCPFHEDKTPSFQVYYKTQTGYCFSSNCKTHGKSLDVIDFIMHKEAWENLGAEGKHKAILKAQEIGGIAESPANKESNNSFDRTIFLTNLFTYFKNALHNSPPAKEYIKTRGLDYMLTEVGYNSGQFHHGTRRDETLIQNCVNVGLLMPYGTNSRVGGQAYKPFGKCCIVFALRNRANQVTGLYFRSTVNEDAAKHYYLKDRSGLYPGYPKANTEKLILTEAVIDAASLLQIPEITKEYEILSCYGTNGLTAEHREAIKEWADIKPNFAKATAGKEIIFAFDADEAGNKAVEKYSKELSELLPGMALSKIELPEGEDINSVYIAHQPDVFTHLLEKRINIFLSNESSIEKKNTTVETSIKPSKAEQTKLQSETLNPKLETSNPYKLRYTTETAHYYIQGGVPKIMDSMKITIVIESRGFSPSGEMSEGQRGQKARNKVDLYEDKQVEKLCKEVSEKLNLRKDLLEADIYKLTDLLDHYRETEIQGNKDNREQSNETIYPLTTQERQAVENFLKKPELIRQINQLLGNAGIVGETNNRIFLLIIAISFKMPETLHALIQGSSGSGKTRLLKQISDCIPPERVTKLTRVSDKVLYNYPEKYFINRLLCLEDVDGLSEEADFAFRELQSNGELNSATSIKLDNGQITSGQKTVKGPIASLACTTRGELYEDNMSRVFLIAVDESLPQTQKIIEYQNQKAAGVIDAREEQKVKRFMQNLIRCLYPYEVINPYANQLRLPEDAHKIRRLNDLFISFVKMITVLNQYRRRKDERNRLITEIEDLEMAVEIMFESIVLKVDELDGSMRQFYEKLKVFIEKKSKGYEFTRFEVREATGVCKTQQHLYMNKLIELEYLQQYGFANRGYRYKIVQWDNYSALRERIKQYLGKQIEQLKPERQRTPGRTPETAQVAEMN